MSLGLNGLMAMNKFKVLLIFGVTFIDPIHKACPYFYRTQT